MTEAKKEHPRRKYEWRSWPWPSASRPIAPPPLLRSPIWGPLDTHFRILDPHASTTDEPPHAFLSPHAASIRALICVDPTPVTADVLDLLPSLRLVVTTSAGFDHINVAECGRRGIAVTNAGNAFSEDVADYTVALLLDVLRRLSAGNRFVRSGLWPQKGEYPLGSKVSWFIGLILFWANSIWYGFPGLDLNVVIIWAKNLFNAPDVVAIAWRQEIRFYYSTNLVVFDICFICSWELWNRFVNLCLMSIIWLAY